MRVKLAGIASALIPAGALLAYSLRVAQAPQSGGVTDHGALTGLADDDHPQYTTDAEATTLADAAVATHEADTSNVHGIADTTVLATDAEVAAAIAAALAAADGAGLAEAGGVLSVNVDGTTLEIDTDTLRVKANGITVGHLAFDPATQAELDAAIAAAVNDGDAAGGVLGGTYPNPSFAVDMATQAELDAHVNDTTDAHDASAISYVPTGTIASTDVQAAIAEVATEAIGSGGPPSGPAGGALDGSYPNPGLAAGVAGAGLAETADVLSVNVDGSTLEISSDSLRVKDGGITAAKVAADVATQAELDAHVNDTSDAHDASAVSVADAGGLYTGTDVEAVLAEIATRTSGPRVVSLFLTAPAGALTTGDGKAFWRVPATYNGFNVVAVAAANLTASSSGNPNFQLRRKRGGSSVDVLSTALTIDANELDSKDAATAAVVNAANDDLATGDILFVDCDAAGTGTLGVTVDVTIQAP